jgi:hypothetical protein
MNDLIPAEEISTSKYGTQDNFTAIAVTSSYLPRLQLFGSNSEMCKTGKIPIAHYGLVVQKDQVEDLGAEVDVIPVSWRPKAMRITEGNAAPLSYYNPQTPEFLQTQKDSEQPNSGCMFGPEFLVYVPVMKRFALYFMSSKTSRRQAPELRALIGKGATLKTQFIKTPKYSWHGPTVTICNSQLDVPSMDEVRSQAEAFNDPEDSSIEFEPAKMEAEPERPR